MAVTELGVIRQEGPVPDPEPPLWKRHDLRRTVVIGLIVAWALAITGVVLFRDPSPAEKPAAAPTPAPSASDAPLTTGEVYEQLLPSVVRVETGGSSLGTGTIVNADGTILTAQHVVAGGGAVTVTYADGKKSAARVLSQDAKKDIATLRPAQLPETVVPASLGGGAKVGDGVVAIGNPLGLTFSTTDGVVSGLNRASRGKAGGAMSGLIQFDAAVNPGSSGGPLLNDFGQVIGVVVSLANPTDAGTFIGIGFAVPIGAALSGGDGDGDGRAPPL